MCNTVMNSLKLLASLHPCVTCLICSRLAHVCHAFFSCVSPMCVTPYLLVFYHVCHALLARVLPMYVKPYFLTSRPCQLCLTCSCLARVCLALFARVSSMHIVPYLLAPHPNFALAVSFLTIFVNMLQMCCPPLNLS